MPSTILRNRRKRNDDEKARRHTAHPDVGRVDGAGQRTDVPLIKAQIPFDFVANGKKLPAGECIIAVVTNGLTKLTIRSGKQAVLALPIADEWPNASTETALVFHRYGDRYFLTGIKRENANGYQLPAGKLERELQARNVPWHAFTLVASAK